MLVCFWISLLALQLTIPFPYTIIRRLIAARMKRREQKSNVSKHPVSRALVKLDAAPIRKKLRQQYDRAQADLRKKQAVLERYQQHDVPLFQQWVHATFGALLSQIREQQQLLHRLRQEWLEITDAAKAWQCATWEAAARLKAGEKPPEPWELDQDDDPLDPDDPHAAHPDAAPSDPTRPDFDEMDEADDADVDEMLGFFVRTLLGDEAANELGIPPARATRQSREDPHTRRLYREIVRRLHPDRHGEMSAAHAAIWHEAQRAYAARDRSTLEILQQRLNIESGKDLATDSVSLLSKMIRHVRLSIRRLTQEIKRCRRDIAWDFSRLENHNALRHQMECELRWEAEQVTWEVNRAQAELDSAKYRPVARPEPVRPRRPRARRPLHDYPEQMPLF